MAFREPKPLRDDEAEDVVCMVYLDVIGGWGGGEGDGGTVGGRGGGRGGGIDGGNAGGTDGGSVGGLGGKDGGGGLFGGDAGIGGPGGTAGGDGGDGGGGEASIPNVTSYTDIPNCSSLNSIVLWIHGRRMHSIRRRSVPNARYTEWTFSHESPLPASCVTSHTSSHALPSRLDEML